MGKGREVLLCGKEFFLPTVILEEIWKFCESQA